MYKKGKKWDKIILMNMNNKYDYISIDDCWV